MTGSTCGCLSPAFCPAPSQEEYDDNGDDAHRHELLLGTAPRTGRASAHVLGKAERSIKCSQQTRLITLLCTSSLQSVRDKVCSSLNDCTLPSEPVPGAHLNVRPPSTNGSFRTTKM